MSDAPPEPRDAATVILLRDTDDADEAGDRFEIFMVRRHGKSGFMAGAHVFPGGVVDPDDSVSGTLARASGRSGEDAARSLGEGDPRRALGLYVAAIRETFEEAGVLLADGAAGVELAAPRARLNDGAPWPALLDELGVTLRLDVLAPWSRWVTPTIERRRYDARFFIARSPAAQRAEHDRIEVTAGEWLSPRGALSRYGRGEISLPPPTLRTLEQLEGEADLDRVFARAAGRVPKPVQPEPTPLDGGFALVLPGDPAHSIAERRIDGPTRFLLEDGRFRSVDPA